jgi:excisionase family DNA binding protein
VTETTTAPTAKPGRPRGSVNNRKARADLPERRWFTLAEAAQVWPVSRKTLNRAISAGRLPVYRFNEGQTRFVDAQDVDACFRKDS